MESPDIAALVHAILEDYSLPWDGDHGLAHWARVLEIGERLTKTTGASLPVVQLFAVLHDSRRRNEHHDPEHGPRAAELAKSLRGNYFELEDADFEKLHRACFGHTHERTHPDVTIQTCWDSDRLDLGRVGITPEPTRLCTDAARDPSMIRWADSRARMRVVPDLIRDDWKIDLRH